MSYVVYNKETTKTMRAKAYGKEYYATEAAAKAFLTRMVKMGYRKEDFAVAEISDFRNNIEKYETVTNLMSGKQVRQSVNTPLSCDVSSETYWSM
jgi:hypothetical protein